MSEPHLPAWAFDVLVCPQTKQPLALDGDELRRADGTAVGRMEDGIVRFPVGADNDGVQHYRAIGGAHFHERRQVAFSMSALDTPVYHAHLAAFRGTSAGIVVDIGGGDGRNAMPFLEWDSTRVVVIDAAGDALVRFRARISQRNPAWVDRVLLIEADARALPLVSGCAERVLSIETLYYLNEDYASGLREAARLLQPDGRLLVSERDFEGGLVMRAIHYGLGAMLRSAETGYLWDGDAEGSVRTRSFTEAELIQMIAAAGLTIHSVAGTPLLSLILGWLRGQGRLDEADEAHLPAVHDLLTRLAQDGRSRRCNVVVASLDPTIDRPFEPGPRPSPG